MKARRRFMAGFKLEVVLEAVHGDRTVAELATRHELDGNQTT
jgi:transposase